MTQPPARNQPGIPMWVWILVLIVVIVALWWILAGDEPNGLTDEPFTEEPGLEAPPATGLGYGTETGVGTPYGTDAGYDTGTDFPTGDDTGVEPGMEPLEEPPPPSP